MTTHIPAEGYVYHQYPRPALIVNKIATTDFSAERYDDQYHNSSISMRKYYLLGGYAYSIHDVESYEGLAHALPPPAVKTDHMLPAR